MGVLAKSAGEREEARRLGLRLAPILQTLAQGYGERPALGHRARELVKDAPTGRTSARLPPRFDTITYRELWARVSAIASAWRRHPDHPVHPGDSAPPIDKYVTDLEHLGLL